MGLQRAGPATRQADRVSISYSTEDQTYHLLLYRNGYLVPFAQCSFTQDMLCDMIDADTERRSEIRLAS